MALRKKNLTTDEKIFYNIFRHNHNIAVNHELPDPQLNHPFWRTFASPEPEYTALVDRLRYVCSLKFLNNTQSAFWVTSFRNPSDHYLAAGTPPHIRYDELIDANQVFRVSLAYYLNAPIALHK